MKDKLYLLFYLHIMITIHIEWKDGTWFASPNYEIDEYLVSNCTGFLTLNNDTKIYWSKTHTTLSTMATPTSVLAIGERHQRTGLQLDSTNKSVTMNLRWSTIRKTFQYKSITNDKWSRSQKWKSPLSSIHQSRWCSSVFNL
jgi:hypothetical protein